MLWGGFPVPRTFVSHLPKMYKIKKRSSSTIRGGGRESTFYIERLYPCLAMHTPAIPNSTGSHLTRQGRFIVVGAAGSYPHFCTPTTVLDGWKYETFET